MPYAPTTSKLTLLFLVCDNLKSTRQRKLPASFSCLRPDNKNSIIKCCILLTLQLCTDLNWIYNQFRWFLVRAKDSPILEHLLVAPMRRCARVSATCVVAVKGIGLLSIYMSNRQSRHALNLPVNGQIVLVPNNQQHLVVGQTGAHVAFDLCRIIDEHTQNVTICRARVKVAHQL